MRVFPFYKNYYLGDPGGNGFRNTKQARRHLNPFFARGLEDELYTELFGGKEEYIKSHTYLFGLGSGSDTSKFIYIATELWIKFASKKYPIKYIMTSDTNGILKENLGKRLDEIEVDYSKRPVLKDYNLSSSTFSRINFMNTGEFSEYKLKPGNELLQKFIDDYAEWLYNFEKKYNLWPSVELFVDWSEFYEKAREFLRTHVVYRRGELKKTIKFENGEEYEL